MGIDFLPFTVETVQSFTLVFTRVSAFIAFMPVLGGKVPKQVRAGLGFFTSLVVFPMVDDSLVSLDVDVFTMALLIVGEAMIGLIAAFIVSLVFAGVQLGGSIMGFQVGFAIVNVMDPTTNQQVSLLGQFMNIIAILIFLTLDVHHHLLMVLAESFTLIPLTGFTFDLDMGDTLLHAVSMVYYTGMQIAAPVTITLLLKQAAMGLIARTVPQMNIMIVGMPLTIAVGLFTLSLTLPTYTRVMANIFSRSVERVSMIFHFMT